MHVFRLCFFPNEENQSKIRRQSFTLSTYNWQPTYAPSRPAKLVRHTRLTSLDKRVSIPWTDNQDDSIEHDVFSITDEADFARVKQRMFSFCFLFLINSISSHRFLIINRDDIVKQLEIFLLICVIHMNVENHSPSIVQIRNHQLHKQ